MSVLTEAGAARIVASGEIPSEPIFRLTVEQYHAMAEGGVLTDDDPVELLEGWLVAKESKKPLHSVVNELAREALDRALPAGWCTSAQEPITTRDSEPEPDVSVVRGDRRRYLKRHPGAKDVALVVEVADVSLRRDRGIKKRVYAGAGIGVYWIVNLEEKQIEVYTEPTGSGAKADYGRRQDFGLSEQVPVVIEGREVGRLAVKEVMA